MPVSDSRRFWVFLLSNTLMVGSAVAFVVINAGFHQRSIESRERIKYDLAVDFVKLQTEQATLRGEFTGAYDRVRKRLSDAERRLNDLEKWKARHDRWQPVPDPKP